jgi:DNA topoisomerase-1
LASISPRRAVTRPGASLSARTRQLNAALLSVAERLGNTLAICKKSYVHPGISQAFLESSLPTAAAPRRRGLTARECDLVAFLEQGSRHRAAA